MKEQIRTFIQGHFSLAFGAGHRAACRHFDADDWLFFDAFACGVRRDRRAFGWRPRVAAGDSRLVFAAV